jgi:glycosyltransferase involved in cell wall biosynthesis
VRILILTQYDEVGASSRIRVYQFLEYLKKNGIEYEVYPLIPKNSAKIFSGFARGQKWIGALYSYFHILRSYLRRYSHVLKARHFDGVLLQKDVLPFGLLRLLLIFNKPIVFEIDDPIWLTHSSMGQDGLLKKLVIAYRKWCFDRVLKVSQAVISDTQPIADYALQYCKKVWVMTSPINAEIYKMTRNQEDAVPTLIWIGSPGTTYLIEDLVPHLDDIAKEIPMRLLNVGGLPLKASFLQIENIGWSIANEVSSLRRAWVGLMPTATDPFNDRKFGYKIWQYYAASLPVLGPNLGLNNMAIRNQKTGLLYEPTGASNLESRLRLILNDRDLRLQMGLNARSLVEQEHDLKVLGPKWAQFLKQILFSLN